MRSDPSQISPRPLPNPSGTPFRGGFRVPGPSSQTSPRPLPDHSGTPFRGGFRVPEAFSPTLGNPQSVGSIGTFPDPSGAQDSTETCASSQLLCFRLLTSRPDPDSDRSICIRFLGNRPGHGAVFESPIFQENVPNGVGPRLRHTHTYTHQRKRTPTHTYTHTHA